MTKLPIIVAMRLGQRAVILGGSIGGLTTAGAIAEYFDEVIILERDELPVGAEHRRGAPQSRHPHYLLNAGRDAIEAIYPDFGRQLLAAGGKFCNPTRECAFAVTTGWLPRRSGATEITYVSRLVVERVLRDRTRALPNVTIRTGASARGLVVEQGRVTGVRYEDATSAEQVITADLVVDALGRGSAVPQWLEAAGFGAIETMTLDAKATYSSRWYRAPPAEADGRWWSQLIVFPTTASGPHPEEHEYICQLYPIEGDVWIAFMAGYGTEMPKTNEEFERRAKRLRVPLFSESLKTAEPVSDAHVTRSTGNKWRRYDRMARPPLGLLPIGDSICAFNPFYGQGMSAAAVSAGILRECLSKTRELDLSLHKTFLRRQSEYLSIPWSLAIGRDQGYEHAVGTEAVTNPVQRKLTNQLAWPVFHLIMAAAAEDKVIEKEFDRVINAQQSMTDMMSKSSVLLRFARFSVKYALGRTRLPRPSSLNAPPPAFDHGVPTTQVPSQRVQPESRNVNSAPLGERGASHDRSNGALASSEPSKGQALNESTVPD